MEEGGRKRERDGARNKERQNQTRSKTKQNKTKKQRNKKLNTTIMHFEIREVKTNKTIKIKETTQTT